MSMSTGSGTIVGLAISAGRNAASDPRYARRLPVRTYLRYARRLINAKYVASNVLRSHTHATGSTVSGWAANRAAAAPAAHALPNSLHRTVAISAAFSACRTRLVTWKGRRFAGPAPAATSSISEIRLSGS